MVKLNSYKKTYKIWDLESQFVYIRAARDFIAMDSSLTSASRQQPGIALSKIILIILLLYVTLNSGRLFSSLKKEI